MAEEEEPAKKRTKTERNVDANTADAIHFEGVPVGAFVVGVQHLSSLLLVLRSVWRRYF